MGESINVPLQIGIAQFIAWFIFAIVIGVFLNGVVCEVYKGVRDRLKFPEIARSAYVSILIPVSPEFGIIDCNEDESSYIELPAVVEQRLGYVLLDDQRLTFPQLPETRHSGLHLLYLGGTADSLSSVRKLPRL